MGEPDLSIERVGNVIRLKWQELQAETTECISEAEEEEMFARDRFEDEAEAVYNAAWDVYHFWIMDAAEEIREPVGKILFSVIEQYLLDKITDFWNRFCSWLRAWIPYGHE